MGIGKCAACQADNAYSRIECHVCGARLPWADAVAGGAQNFGHTSPVVGRDEPSFILAILGFFCWPAGIIVWALQRDQYPRRSSSALKGAVASLVLSVSLFVIALAFQAYAVNRIAQQTTFTTVSNAPFNFAPRSNFGNPSNGFNVSPGTTLSVSPAPIVTPIPSPTPIKLRYTRAQFNKLKIGMTYQEAVKIMGDRGSRIGMSYPDGTSNVGYLWSNHDDTNNDGADYSTDCTITVKNERIIRKDNNRLR